MGSKHLMTLRQRTDAVKLLDAHLKKVEGTEFFVYDDGVSDKSIADAFGVGHYVIRNMRLATHGELAPAAVRTIADTQNIANRIERLEKGLEEALSRIASLEKGLGVGT